MSLALASPGVITEALDAYTTYFRGFEPVPAARADIDESTAGESRCGGVRCAWRSELPSDVQHPSLTLLERYLLPLDITPDDLAESLELGLRASTRRSAANGCGGFPSYSLAGGRSLLTPPPDWRCSSTYRSVGGAGRSRAPPGLVAYAGVRI